MRSKVLLHRLGRQDLAEWVNLELTGYPEEAEVPKYRVLNAMVRGVVTNGYHRYPDFPLPTKHLSEKSRLNLENMKMLESISALEGFAKTKELQRPLPIEFNSLFSKQMTGGYYVERAWCDIGFGQVEQIVTQVRSRLLDFLLGLSGKVDEDMTEADVRRLGQSAETGSMFNNAIFGDNATILVGNQNSQRVKNEVSRGDFEALSALLKKNAVDAGDIEDLRASIRGRCGK
jgi:hypothetical protein